MKERTKLALKWAPVVNEMGTGLRPIICQVVALCNQSRSCCLQHGGVSIGAVH